jgi:hypothetical protein
VFYYLRSTDVIKRLFVIALFSLPLLADEFENATLHGLTSFHVAVEDFYADDIQAGLNQQDIKTAAELRCRMAGVLINSAPSEPYLYINIVPLEVYYVGHRPSGIYAVAIRVELRQRAFLSRDPAISAYAGTWSRVSVITAPRERLVSYCHESLNNLVDEFLNAYLAQNPKRGLTQ